MIRKIQRNKLKNMQGNNKIKQEWRKKQIKKYGIIKWCIIYNQSQKMTNKANKAYKGNAYII